MEKINFVNNSTPALNETNLNKLQDNVEDAIGEVEDSIQEVVDKIKTTQTASDTDTYSCNYVNNLIKYSTEETTGGIWIDNKQIYRKTIVFTNTVSANSSFTLAHGISNISTIVNLNARMFNTSTKRMHTLPLVGYDNSLTLKINTYVDNQYIYIYSNDSWGTGWQKMFTIEYTKTTD